MAVILNVLFDLILIFAKVWYDDQVLAPAKKELLSYEAGATTLRTWSIELELGLRSVEDTLRCMKVYAHAHAIDEETEPETMSAARTTLENHSPPPPPGPMPALTEPLLTNAHSI